MSAVGVAGGQRRGVRGVQGRAQEAKSAAARPRKRVGRAGAPLQGGGSRGGSCPAAHPAGLDSLPRPYPLPGGIVMPKDPATNTTQGYAFIEFGHPHGAVPLGKGRG